MENSPDQQFTTIVETQEEIIILPPDSGSFPGIPMPQAATRAEIGKIFKAVGEKLAMAFVGAALIGAAVLGAANEVHLRLMEKLAGKEKD